MYPLTGTKNFYGNFPNYSMLQHILKKRETEGWGGRESQRCTCRETVILGRRESMRWGDRDKQCMCLHMLYLAKSVGCSPKQCPVLVSWAFEVGLSELHFIDEVRERERARERERERERERDRERERGGDQNPYRKSSSTSHKHTRAYQYKCT